MRKFKLEAKRRVKNDLKKLPKETLNSTAKAIEGLQENPFPSGKKIKTIKGAEKTFRYRVGDYRIIYEVGAQTVTILAVLHRRDLGRFQ
ncbi:MAG: type II toxin-antitoxin system RelE/ParE family toxin [Actinomycetota bacterium]|nr:type II toxin-antitoxin system RelE/ParE family toxin [Actinomycetota bacterium]